MIVLLLFELCCFTCSCRSSSCRPHTYTPSFKLLRLLPRPDSIGDGVLFSIDLFVCLFVSLSARLRENGWTDLDEISREGVDCGVTTGLPDYVFGQFREIARCRDANFLHGGGVCCASHHSLLLLLLL